MERYDFERQKTEILKNIEDAARQGDSLKIYTCSRIMRDLENEFHKVFSENDPRSLIVDFSVS